MLLDNLQAAAIEQPVSYYFTSFYHCFYSFHGSNSLCKWIYERFLQDIFYYEMWTISLKIPEIPGGKSDRILKKFW